MTTPGWPRRQGRVIWITGLSGAGKTTLAEELLPLLPEATIWYDGHHTREIFKSVLDGGYSREARLKDSWLCCPLFKHSADQGLTVVCSTITMFHEIQEWNRRNLPGYFEIFLDMPMPVLIERDYKGVYKNLGDKSTPVIGREITPELPRLPEMHIKDPALSPQELAKMIIERINSNN